MKNAVLYEIRDRCRANLNIYTIDAFEYLPDMNNPCILDLGCGTGVPALLIAQLIDCNITCVDTDKESIDYFKEKIHEHKLQESIEVINKSILETTFPEAYFDIILAEGIFNITGFKKAFGHTIPFLRSGGYFLIHDEFSNRENKIKLFKKHKCELLKEIIISQYDWEGKYINCLKESIIQLKNSNPSVHGKSKVLSALQDEVAYFDKNPSEFKSRYYIIQKKQH